MKEPMKIALAFLGVLIGAGFATGNEVIQYFTSFGITGFWGALVSGIIMGIGGAVILQLGSFFLAKEHNMVFSNVAHPVVSRLLDISVTVTLFAIGFVMLAGSGSNLEQQFGIPAWTGSLLMTVMVILTGLLDVDKVTDIIGMITPLLILAATVAFIYTMFNLPSDLDSLDQLARQEQSPVQPWWLSALNYNGMALILGVSMTLVIGGNYSNMVTVGRAGLLGGVMYTVLLGMLAFTMLMNFDEIGGVDVPMQALFSAIHPALGYVMTFIILGMIYNTAIAMFYALGRRVTASRPQWNFPALVALTVAGFGVSFVGFNDLMNVVYPILGWLGLAMLVVLVGWWLFFRERLVEEDSRRNTIRGIISRHLGKGRAISRKEKTRLRAELKATDADARKLFEQISEEVGAATEGQTDDTADRTTLRQEESGSRVRR